MDRTHTVLLNGAVNWCAGYFNRDKCVYITDDYDNFVWWLRDADVIIAKVGQVDNCQERRYQQRRVHVKYLTTDVETGRLEWPNDLSQTVNICGIFSDPVLLRSIRGRRTASILVPSTTVSEIRSWDRRISFHRLDVLWSQSTRFKFFMQRQLQRAGIKGSLQPADFRFLSKWIWVVHHMDDSPSSNQWFWPLPLYSPSPSVQEYIPQKTIACTEALPNPPSAVPPPDSRRSPSPSYSPSDVVPSTHWTFSE